MSRGAAPTGEGAPAARSVTIVWLVGGGCEGCTMSVLGATSPRLEELLSGNLTRIERVELIHPVLTLEAGDGYLAKLEAATEEGAEPYVLVLEGSLFDEARAGSGSFSALGSRDGEPVTISSWVSRLAPGAAAVVAIGTCATWGGIPAAQGNTTGAMGLDRYLGEGFRSRLDLPIINVPGCAPIGDNFVETLAFLLLHMEGTVPLDLDELGRPRWLYSERTPVRRPTMDWLDAPPPPSEAVADCNVPTRGWINRVGGCAAVGGACNGCTMPGFPDRYLSLATSPRADG